MFFRSTLRADDFVELEVVTIVSRMHDRDVEAISEISNACISSSFQKKGLCKKYEKLPQESEFHYHTLRKLYLS